ncbi:RecD-like DNA helicase Atu2026 [hydrothermal vent metagenome]|uniref:RecD-like DNA helicase Atu2026 n=1 Tax=hydrothermal vent metagenome TaxID=652676 RepID=A0A3B0T4D8_9ZZZZ
MQWSSEQDASLVAISRWVKGGGPQVFRLFGYAGTGKTTLATHIAEGVDGDVLFGAFTGKAALVMRRRGCAGARTIHSMIYRPDIKGEGEDGEGPSFKINRASPVRDAALVIVDECSMVDEALGADLLSFGRPVLVLGDPAQLPPVKGGGFFTEAEPDAMLTEIHRQAADNPIIRLAARVRSGEGLEKGTYGESRVISRRDLDTDDVVSADAVLVGLNRTRRLYNGRLRELNGRESLSPEVGDKLVCLRNNHKKGLLNGGIWTVDKLIPGKGKRIVVRALPEGAFPGAKSTRLRIHPAYFDGTEKTLTPKERREGDAFDYGYALTVHKAQGSQWDHVVLFDEAYAFREHRARWLYTGVTRAAEKLTVVV